MPIRPSSNNPQANSALHFFLALPFLSSHLSSSTDTPLGSSSTRHHQHHAPTLETPFSLNRSLTQLPFNRRYATKLAKAPIPQGADSIQRPATSLFSKAQQDAPHSKHLRDPASKLTIYYITQTTQRGKRHHSMLTERCLY
jgi:hypothetical protein